jgi:acylphosphatase
VTDNQVRITAFVGGHVQGVGFRWYTRAKALELGLTGRATNLSDGRVEVVAEGPESAVQQLVEWLQTGETPGRVDFVTVQNGPVRGDARGFDVR